MNSFESKARSPVVRIAFALLVVIGLFAAARHLPLQQWLQTALTRINELGPWKPVGYIIFYMLACIIAIPGSLLTLAGGVLFGVGTGTVYVSIAATLGATCAFLVGRYLLRGWIVRRLGKNEKFHALDEAVAREGWRIVLLVRLCPILPFPVTNYGFGITRVRLSEYVLASWIGMLPATIVLVYIGSLAGSVANLTAGGRRTRTPLEWTVYGIGLVVAIIVTIYITRIARRALAEKTRPATEPG